MVHKLFLSLLVLFFSNSSLLSQITDGDNRKSHMSYQTTPRIALKNNLLLDATLSLNLTSEMKIADYYTLELAISYNPWKFNENRKFNHFLIQPELRRWLCEPFFGHFFGLHPTYAFFNVGNLHGPGSLKNKRYEGHLYGAGVSYGYHWPLSSKWSMEATAGVGYLYMDYDRFGCTKCSAIEKSRSRHYFGPTRLGVSLIYILK